MAYIRESDTRYKIKRSMDIILAGLGLILALPLMVAIALAIKLESPGPVIFKTTRVGRRGKPFTMYKFRSMRSNAEEVLKEIIHLNEGGPYMIKIRNDPRVTWVGHILRRTSLDELPQLVNVLKGEMSLVGPRPQAPNEVALYNAHQHRRLEAVPGITGLWQVTARDNPSFDEWVRLDLEYIENWSLGLELQILLRTALSVITGRGGRVQSRS